MIMRMCSALPLSTWPFCQIASIIGSFVSGIFIWYARQLIPFAMQNRTTMS